MTLKTYEMIKEMKDEITMLRADARAKMPTGSDINDAYYTGRMSAFRECYDLINTIAIQFMHEELQEAHEEATKRWKNLINK